MNKEHRKQNRKTFCVCGARMYAYSKIWVCPVELGEIIQAKQEELARAYVKPMKHLVYHPTRKCSCGANLLRENGVWYCPIKDLEEF